MKSLIHAAGRAANEDEALLAELQTLAGRDPKAAQLDRTRVANARRMQELANR